jgi:glycosyltransferase involved in cell wall biosynthesis
MNEVWVPSPWQAASFIASGVDPNKVRVVPEGVNTTLYDPALYTPLALEKTAELVFGRSWADKALSRQQQQQRQQQTQQQAQHPEKQTAAGLRLQQQQQPLEDPQPAAVEGTSHPAAAPAATPQAPAAAEQARGAGTSELPPISSRPFVFLSTFKWERRKGWDVLLEAYLSEFTSEDDVELYILTKPYGKSGSGFQDMMQDWARDKLGGMQQGQGQGRAARQLLAHGGDLSDTKQLLRRGQGPAEGGAEVGSSLNQAAGAELDEQQQQQQLEELPEVSEEEFLHWYQQHNRQDVGVGGTAATAELFDTSRWQAGQAPWGMELTPLLNATTSSNHNAPGNAASSSSSSGSSTKEGGEASRTRGVRQQVHHIRSWLSSELLPRLQAAGAVPPHWLGTAPQPPAAGHINQQQQAQQQEEQVGSQTPAVAVAAQHDAGGGGPSRQLLQQPAAAVGGQRDAVVHVADDSVAGSRQDNTATVEVVPDAPVVDQEEKAQVAHTPATQSAGAVHSSTKANSSSPDESVPSVATLTPSGAVLVTAGGDTSGLLSGLQGSDPTLAAAAGGADTAAPAGPAFPTLYVVHRHISDEDFPRIYKAADAFVLPSRGEGWGRPHVEAMSMGLPVIATNWSGVTAYLDETVGYPLPIEDVVPVQAQADSEWWFRGLRWAQPSVKELRKLMRHVYENREEAAAKGAAARQRMVEKYSPPAIAEAVLKEVQRIERLLG